MARDEIDDFLDAPDPPAGDEIDAFLDAPDPEPTRPPKEFRAPGVPKQGKSPFQGGKLTEDPNDPKFTPERRQKTRENLRTLVEVGVPLATIPFTGPVGGLAARSAAAALSGGGASLAAEALDPSDSAGQALKRAGTNAALSVAGEGAGTAVAAGAKLAAKGARSAASALAEKAAPALEKYAGGQFSKAAGLYGRAAVRRVGGAESARDLGMWARARKLVTGGASREKIAQRAADLNKQAGETIGQLRQQAQELGYGPKSSWITGQLERLATPYRKYGNEFAKKLAGIVDQFKDDLASNTDEAGRVLPETLDDLKGQLDGQLDSLFQSGRAPKAVEDLRLGIRSVLKEAEERVVDQLGGGFEVAGRPAGEAFRRAKEDYGNTLDLLRWMGYSDEGDLANLGLGLRETGIVLGGLIEPTAAAGAFVGKRLLDRYGNSTAGVVAEKAAGAARQLAGAGAEVAQTAAPRNPEVGKILRLVSDRGPQEVAAAAALLLSKYPEDREVILQETQRLRGSPRP